MAKIYKKKWIAHEWSSDNRDNTPKMRKAFNSAERWRGKREAVSQLEEYQTSRSKEEIQRLRWNLEMELADECYHKEISGPEAYLAWILLKLDIGRFNLHKCTCPKPETLSEEELLKHYGF